MLKLLEFWRRWRADERGAATADYVVLTGGVVLLGIAVVWLVFDQGVSAAVQKASTELASASLASPAQAPVEQEAAGPASEAGQSVATGGDGGEASSGTGAAAPVVETAVVQQAAAAATQPSEAIVGDEETGKANNGRSDLAHDNPGKHLAKGAAK